MDAVVTVYDTVGGVDQIPANAQYFLWYVDGNYRTEAAIRARFPNAQGLSLSVDGAAAADFIDVESGDATVEQAIADIRSGRYRGAYSSVSNWGELARGLSGYPWQFISANWTGVPHIDSVAVGTQWASPVNHTSPGDYDISWVFGSLFGLPSTPPVPAVPTTPTIIKPLEGPVGSLNAPIVAIAAMPGGSDGYTLVGADGGTFNYGTAPFLGSLASQHLNAPIVDAKHTADGQGLVMVATDGGVFCFGDAQFEGSEGNQHLNAPVVGIDLYEPAGSTENGYWLTAADGGVFSFGAAPFEGSAA